MTRLPIVFAGPSLPDSGVAREHLDANYRPPARQGDVARAVLSAPAAIVLIDGYFERVPATYHKEILWALDQGIPVYGASSIGALRASELDAFGMVGVGEIYEAFHSGTLDRDDEVALLHGPAELNYPLLSEPLVNIRWTLSAAVDAKVITRATADRFVETEAARFYPQRSFKGLSESRIDGVSAEDIKLLTDWLQNGRVDQKGIDAVECLKRVADDLDTGNTSVTSSFVFNHTDAFEQVLNEVTDVPFQGMSENARNEEILEQYRTFAPRKYDTLFAQATIDVLALRSGSISDGGNSPAMLVQAVGEFRASRGLSGVEDLSTWLADMGVDIETLSRRLDESVHVSRICDTLSGEIEERMLDLLVLDVRNTV